MHIPENREPATGVVIPEGQLWQSGLGDDTVPPADHVPAGHCLQPVPP